MGATGLGFRRSLALACLAVAYAAFSPMAQAAQSTHPTVRSPGWGAPVLPLGHAGRWITDAEGRVVIVHGVNMVYKLAPYYPAAVGFGADDAAFLQRIGLDAVRLGVIWKAIEPRPGIYDDAYLSHIAATVSMLGRHGILSLLDFHQDMYNERFQGEGAPDWAVRDDGLPALPKVGFPGNYEQMPALQRAYDNFWTNHSGPGGVGLQDRYAAAWRHVAERFKKLRSVLGYELFNEPFPGSDYLSCLSPSGCAAFDAKLTNFDRRVAAAIRTVDRRSLIFYEPNILFDFGFPTDVGALGDPQAGFGFHDYCLASDQSNGCPSEAKGFTNALAHVARTREALLLTEFGSTPAAGDLTGMVARADREMVPWLEWSYCPCRDPTGSTPDPLVENPLKPPARANLGALALRTLVEPYPQLIAGTPRRWSFNAATRMLRFTYTSRAAGSRGRFPAGSLTQVAAPRLIYPGGYAARLSGGRIVSRRGADVLQIALCPQAKTVSVTVTSSGRTRGACRSREAVRRH